MAKPPTVAASSVVGRELLASLPEWTVAVDPGESCGLAFIGKRQSFRADRSMQDYIMTLTLPPEEAVDRFAHWFARAAALGQRPTLIIEEYRIYPDKAMAHAGKTVPTAEAIGMFKYAARRLGGNTHRVIEQPASIKQTTAAMLRTRGIPLGGSTRHAKDAELHMWYPVLRSKYSQPKGGKRAS